MIGIVIRLIAIIGSVLIIVGFLLNHMNIPLSILGAVLLLGAVFLWKGKYPLGKAIRLLMGIIGVIFMKNLLKTQNTLVLQVH